MKKQVEFSIIICNYNGIKYLQDCLSSVVKTNYRNYEIILVEDGSTDGSKLIAEKYQKQHQFKIIRNSQNLGLVASRNKAIHEALGEILVFLDNDTQVDRNWLKGLSKVFEEASVGAAQCKIFDYKKRVIIQEIGMKLIPYTGFGSTIGRGETDHGQYKEKQEIIALGAAVAVRKKVAVKINGFDNQLFHYTDDLDFSWRIWIAGFRVVLAPNAHVYHYTKEHSSSYRLYLHLCKNSIRMIVKNYEWSNVLIFLPISIIMNLLGSGLVLATRLRPAAFFGVIMGLIWSILSIPDLIRTRYLVQSTRQVSDQFLFNKIMISTNILDIFKTYSRNRKKNDILTANASKL